MPTRKRKSTAVASASQDAGVERRSSSPSASPRKRPRRTAASASQQDQPVQEQDDPENSQTGGREVQLGETVKSSPSKMSSKKGKAACKIVVKKPDTPQDTLSSDAEHLPTDDPSPKVVINVNVPKESKGSNSSAQASDTRVETVVGLLGSGNQENALKPQSSPFRTILAEGLLHLFTRNSPTTSKGLSTGERGQLGLTEVVDVEVMNGISSSPPGAVLKSKAVAAQPDPTAELEVQRFEEVTSSLNKDLGSVRATLQILCTELQTLGFADTNATSDVVLANVRAAFREARAHLNELMPEVDASSHQNGDLLKLLTTNIRALLATVAEKEGQHSDLLTRLAKSEERKLELQGTLHQTDMLADKRAREMLQLEDDMRNLRDVFEEQESALEERDATVEERDIIIEDLREDLADANEKADGLRAELEKTLDVLEKAKIMVTAIEHDHKEAEKKHAAEMKDAVERYGEDQAANIAELEDIIGGLTNDIEVLRDRLAKSTETTDMQVKKFGELVRKLSGSESAVKHLEGKLEEAEKRIATLNEELYDVRTRAGSERHQREAAEAELDHLHTKVESLTSHLHGAVLQATELNGKLFEVQQLRESESQAMKAIIAAEKDKFEQDLSIERVERTKTEQQLTELSNVTLPGLEAKLQDVERTSAELQAIQDACMSEKQRLVDTLETEGIERDARHSEYITTKSQEVQSLRDDIAKLQKEKASLEARVESEAVALLEAQDVHADSIASLNSAIKMRDVEIGKLLQEVQTAASEHENALAACNGQIQDLEEKLMKSVQLGRDAVTRMSAAHVTAHDASQQMKQTFFQDAETLVGDSDIIILPKASEQQSRAVTRQRSSLRGKEQAKVKAHVDHDSGVLRGPSDTDKVFQDTDEHEAA